MSRPGETKDTLFAVMEQIQQFKQELRTRQIRMPLEVAEFVFAHPVATPVQMGRETGIHYKTASRYLVQLAAEGLLESKQVGRYQFYLNRHLLEVLSRA